jgi:putative FmdB family regulatory protein
VPTYQYQCKQCGYELEELQSMNEAPLVRCPSCHTDNLARILGTGGGLIFKGTGFYLTDYKKETPKPSTGNKKKEGTSTERKDDKTPSSGSEAKSSETKPSTENKPTPKKDEGS